MKIVTQASACGYPATELGDALPGAVVAI